MADVAQSTAVKVVSNNSSATNGVSELTACSNDPCAELTLNLPSPDEEEGTSLQELIESELAALRRKEELLIDSELSTISNTFSETVVVDDDDIDTEKAMGDTTSPPTRDNNDLSINTQFLLAERDHSFQISKGDAMFFFNTVVDDEPPINGLPTNPFVEDDQEMSSEVPEGTEEALMIDTGTIDSPQEAPDDVTDEFHQSSTVQVSEENLQESPDLSDTSPVVKDPSDIDILPLSTTFDPFTTIVDNSNSKSEPAETPSSECADTDFNSLLPVDNGVEKSLEDGVDEIEGTLKSRVVVGGVPVESVDTLLDFTDDSPEKEMFVSPSNVDVVFNYASNSMEDLECAGMSDNSSVGSKRVPVVTNVFETLEVDDEDLPGLTSPIEPVAPQRTLTIPEIGIIPPQDDDNTDEISESELVSNEELSIGSNGVPAQPVVDLDSPADQQVASDIAEQADVFEPPADQQAAAGVSVEEPLVDFDSFAEQDIAAGVSAPLITDLDSPTEPKIVAAADVGFDTWTTVGEAVIEETTLVAPVPVHDDVPVLCDTNKADESLSDSEQNESISSVSSIDKKLKKKKKSEGGETTKTKKTKKTKKSDEKENISVIANSSESTRTEIETNKENSTKEARIEDDLSNVSVTVLKSTYSNQIRTQAPKDVVKEIDEDILHCGSIQSLKQTYCSEASKGFHKRDAPEQKKELIATGISIKELRRSFGDLRNVGCEDTDEGPESQEQNEECMKSSFSKFDQLSKKTVLHVRSVDASKVQKQFNQSAPEQQLSSNCKACGKQVFQMEQIKAERAVWHKNCFRCKECNKQLTVDIYSSHEGQLYCKPHFRELFKPKAVLDDESNEPPRLRKPELIIRENQPIELPPEVVRASDKPDLGLEELSALNVKSRYQVFEKAQESNSAEVERSPSSVSVKRSPSILSKLARFQAKGMDIGVTDDSLNGIPIEESSSSSEEENEDDVGENGETDKELIRSNRKKREQPISFTKMEDVKSRWETGQAAWREEQRQERKQEIQNLRSKLFMGKQGKMKEMYEQAVKESESCTQKKEVGIRCEKAKTIKEKFERGEVLPDDDDGGVPREQEKKGVDEDMSVFEAGISKKSRSLFLELDATAAKQPPTQILSPVKSPVPKDDSRRRSREVILASRQTSEDVVRSSDQLEEVKVETAEISNKFKFFETYKEPEKQKRQFRITPPREGQVKTESPEREIYRDPEVVRCEDKLEDEEVMRTNTAKKMLSLFRQLEENATKEELPEGPKPLKRFTPPPDYTQDSETEEEESESEEEDEEEEEEEGDPNIVRASDKIEDEFLKQAQTAARAKALRAKFERWEEKENKANANAATNASHAVGNLNGALDQEQAQEFQPSIDTTRSLRARFESLKNETPQPKERTPRPKVNRFVEIQTNCAEFCSTCGKKVYPLEKIETGGKIFHKQCFRCLQCNCILRMETYTLNNGKPYCIPHFKQLFIAKGNYEEGFGMDQHKRKWNSRNNSSDDNDILSGLNSSTED